MIKNGNYYFLNFCEHKDEFIEAFTKYFGEKNREKITDKINNCGYYPYLSEDAVTDYYNQFITLFREDIIKEYCMAEGIKELSPQLKNFIMNEEGRSGILTASVYGKNLREDNLLIPDEKRKHNLEVRLKAYELLGIEEGDFETLQEKAKLFDKCCRRVTSRNKCDVFKDFERLEDNRARQTQSFLTNEVMNGSFTLTDADMEIIAKPDFDWIDVENLDCNNVLFKNSLDVPGWNASFTSESDKILENGSINEKIEILLNRVKYFYSISEDKKTLTFVSSGELFSKTPIKNVQDFYERLKYQYEVYATMYPTYDVLPEVADATETRRKFYCQDIFNGCKFASNINKRINGHIQSPNSDTPYLTCMWYAGGNMNVPTADIFFDEGEYYSPDVLIGNLIHELCHLLAHDKAHPTKDPNYVKARDGIRNVLIKLEKDGESFRKKIDRSDDNVLVAEENMTERMAGEVRNIFNNMYENPFEASDLPYSEQEDWSCQYDAWDFLTEDFYTTFKAFIKEHRINSDYDMYFDEPVLPTNIVNKTLAKIEEFLRKKFKKPCEVQKSGVMDYKHVEELGNLVGLFKKEVYPVLVDYGVSIDEWTGREEGENVKRLPMDTRRLVEGLKSRAKELHNTMVDEFNTYAAPRLERERKQHRLETRERNKKYKIKQILTKSDLRDVVTKAVADSNSTPVDGGELEPTM